MGLIVNGTLNADGATFQGQGSGSWTGISYESGSSGTLNDCTIEDVSGYGAIRANGASPSILYSTVSSSGTGIRVTGSGSVPIIKGNTITAAGYGMNFYDAAGFVDGNTLVGPGQGGTAVMTSVYANPALGPEEEGPGHNDVSSFYWGLWAETAAMIWSYNDCVYDMASYDAFAMDGGEIVAENDWWGGSAPYVDTDETGFIDYTPYVGGSSCPWNSAFKNQVEAVIESPTPFGDDADLVRRAREWIARGETAAAIDLLKEIANAEPSTRDSRRAIIELGRLVRRIMDPSLAEYLHERAKEDTPTRPDILALLIDYQRNLGEDLFALELASSLESENTGTWRAFYGQWQAFDMHMDAGRDEEAARVWSRMKPSSPVEVEEVEIARARLGALAGKFDPGASPPHAALGQPPPAINASVYPSPFNPVTSVVFDLAFQAAVDVSVYDALGRRISSLIHGPYEAGRHTVVWDAHDRPSGAYFIVIRANESFRTLPVSLIR